MIRKVKTITGRLIDARTVALDEAVGAKGDRVRITVEADSTAGPEPKPQNLVEFIQSLPPGTRSKADIDAQIAEERSSWGGLRHGHGLS